MENKYSLLAMKVTQQNLRYATQERFNRINSRYILVYKNATNATEHYNDYHIIDQKEVEHLNADERLWLMDCNIQLINEETAEKKDEILERISERLEKLEAELDKESRIIERGTSED